MKIGLSSYSLSGAMSRGEMDILQVIRWCAENGAEQIELVPLGGLEPSKDPSLCREIVRTAQDAGIELGNYSVGGNFMGDDEKTLRAELDRIKHEVDTAASMGIRNFRTDVAHFGGSFEQNTISSFRKLLPQLAAAAAAIADHAVQYGITVNIENHGWFMNGSERVRMMVEGVARKNYGLQLDVGNFVCVDEDPVIAVRRSLPITNVVHFKDFYLRRQPVDLLNMGGGCWFPSQFGTALQGSVVGWGDVDVFTIARLVRESGFDGIVSLEFEGAEECKMASKAGLTILKKLLRE